MHSQEPDNVGWQRELAAAYPKVGSILAMREGRLDDALAAYSDSVAIFQHLASQEPTNANWQRELGLVYFKVGDILIKLGRRSNGMERLREAQIQMERAISMAPGITRWLKDLARIKECSDATAGSAL